MIERDEFETFYGETVSGLEKFVLRLSGSAAAAAEIVQESYFRFLRSGFTGDSIEDRRRYLYRIAINLVRKGWRDARMFEPIDESVLEPRRGENDIDVNAILQRMKPKDRALLWLAYAEGCSHAEIAEMMRLGRASVRVLLFRARSRFIALMKGTT